MKKIFYLIIGLIEINSLHYNHIDNDSEKALLIEQYEPDHFENIFGHEYTGNKKEEIKLNLRNKNIKVLYAISIFSTLLAFICTLVNYLTSITEDRRWLGLVTSGLEVLITSCFLTFFNYKSILKWMGLVYLFFISWLLFLSGFIVSQIGPYEGIYGNLSGSATFSDYGIFIWLGGNIAFYIGGLGLLLEHTKLTHYEVISCCLNFF